VFDPQVQTYCNTSKFSCPNYSHSWGCPPVAPYLEKKIFQFHEFYLIYYKYDLNKYIKDIKSKHSHLSEKKIRNDFYRKDIMRDYLESEIQDFIKNYSKPYKEVFILWDGYCRICSKQGKSCTYDDNKPCRYPDQIQYSMEAVGIDVNKTVSHLNLNIEWPPIHYIYRFGLVCYV
jgi:predicted metal-binding protein